MEVSGIKLSQATFGENLSVSGLKEDDVCIGGALLAEYFNSIEILK